MLTSRYWKIHYGPEAYDEEIDHVADVISNRLMRLKAKGFVEHSLVYIVKSEDSNGELVYLSADPDDWKDVVALVKTVNETTDANLRMRLTLANTKHELLFIHDCRYVALNETQFQQLVIEYESNRL